MQVVILAAGRSTRTYPLTCTKPKPLLRVANKTIIEHTLDQLQGIITHAVIVAGYKKNQLEKHLGSNYQGISISFVEQKELNGTANAVLAAKDLLEDRFIVMNGDDFFSKDDIVRCLEHDQSILVKEVNDLSRFGEVLANNGYVEDLIEKSNKGAGFANTGLYVFTKKVLDKKINESVRGEYEITDYIKNSKNFKVIIAKESWIPVSYPWNLLEANEFLLKDIKEDRKGTIEDGATIKGTIVVGKNTLIKSGAYIEGPVVIGENCTIGPNCYIRPNTTIGDNSKIGNAVDIKNTIIGKNTSIAHLSYIGDSVLGDDVNIAAGVITANLRHDGNNIKSMVGDNLVDTGRRKLGVIIGDGAKIGINTSIYPGRKIWPDMSTIPNEIVKKDIK